MPEAQRKSLTVLLLTLTTWCSAFSSTGGPEGYNVLDNYCNRLFSQSTIKNGSIWNDGGLQSFAQWRKNNSLLSYYAIGPKFNATNSYLIQTPVSESWDWKTNITQTALNMTAPNPLSGTSPPQVYQGALYQGPSSSSKIWLYGGTYSWLSQNMSWFLWPNSQHYSIWSYDIGSDEWEQYDISSEAPFRPSHGYAAEAPDQSLGFYFNGKLDNGSSTETSSMDDQVVFLEGMVVLDLSTGTPTARNVSTFVVTNGSPRVGGKASYMPSYGEKGLVAFIGGGEKSTLDHSSDGLGSLLPMDQILLFDVASLHSSKTNATDSAWYVQQATGEIPEPRADFCIIGVPAPDNSSYTIYLYGGRNQTTAFDDVYALTMPAFIWTRVYFSGTSPRYGHDCHLVSGRQMITLGGAQTEKLDKCDWEVAGIAVYDLSLNQWGSVYDASLTNYTIPTPIVSVIGGSPTGGAIKTSPAAGWANAGVAKAFKQKSHATKSSTKLSRGAIAGIVVGILAFAIACGSAVYVFFARRRMNKQAPGSEPREVDASSTGVHEKEGENTFMHEKEGDFHPVRELHGDHAVELPADETQFDPMAIIGQR